MPASPIQSEHALQVPADLSSGLDIHFCRRLTQALEERPHQIRLDCSQLNPVHSSHIGLLWQAREICRRESVEIILENSNSGLLRTLRALDLADFFILASIPDNPPAVQPDRPGTPSEAEYTAEFTADIKGVDQTMLAFLEFLQQLDLSDEIRFDLRTLFYEVATNIRSHAGLTSADKVLYTASYGDGQLRLVFEDHGRPFDPTTYRGNINPQTAAQNRQTRGFGIGLIRRLADEINYERRENVLNVLALSKDCGGVQ